MIEDSGIREKKNLRFWLSKMIGGVGDMNWLEQTKGNHRGLVWLLTPIYHAHGVATHSRCILGASIEANLSWPSSPVVLYLSTVPILDSVGKRQLRNDRGLV